MFFRQSTSTSSEIFDETFVSFYHNMFLIVAIYWKFDKAMKAVCIEPTLTGSVTMTLWEHPAPTVHLNPLTNLFPHLTSGIEHRTMLARTSQLKKFL